MKALVLALVIGVAAGCFDPRVETPAVECEAQALMLEYDNRDPEDDPTYEPEPCQEANQ